VKKIKLRFSFKKFLLGTISHLVIPQCQCFCGLLSFGASGIETHNAFLQRPKRAGVAFALFGKGMTA
jgi:hypothetical protein